MSKLREPCRGAWSGGWQVSADTRAPNDFRLPEIENRTWLLKPEPKNRPLHGGGTACVGEVLRGGGKTVYIDSGAVGLAAVGSCCVGAVESPVLVINRTSTRRFLARPSRVLLLSTGLSLPSPIKYTLWAGML